MPITNATNTFRLDAAGDFSVTLPISDPQALKAKTGDIWLHFQEGSGLRFAGLIESRIRIADDAIVLSGPTVLGQLVYLNTLRGRDFDSIASDVIIDNLLQTSDWTRSGTISTTVTARFDGESLLTAILAVLEQQGNHLREVVSETNGVLTKILEIGSFGVASGVFITGGHPDQIVMDESELALVQRPKIIEDSNDVWNWLVPLGGGDGEAQITLEHNTKQPNLIPNPSFDSALSGWIEGGIGSSAFQSTHAVHGNEGIYLNNLGVTTDTQRRSRTDIPASPGNSYRMEGWFWPISGTGEFIIRFLDVSLVAIETHEDVFTVGTGAWERLFAGPFIAPTGTVWIEYNFVASEDSEVYADYAICRETAASLGIAREIGTEVADTTSPLTKLVFFIEAADSIGASTLIPVSADEIVAVDAVSETGPGATTADAISWTHSVNAGDDRYLLVGIMTEAATQRGVDSITYNGATMSLLGSAENASIRTLVYGLINPDIGTHTITIEFDGAYTGSELMTGATSFFHVDQDVSTRVTTGFAAAGSKPGDEVGIGPITDSVPGNLLHDFFASAVGQVHTVEDNQIERFAMNDATSSGGGSTQQGGIIDGIGAKLSWDGTSTATWAQVIVEVLHNENIYGKRQKFLVAKDIIPLTGSKADLQIAANALYDGAVAELGYTSQEQVTYALECKGVSPQLLVGDTVYVRYVGEVVRFDDTIIYMDIDRSFSVLEITRSWSHDGVESTSLTVSNIVRESRNNDAGIFRKLQATSTAYAQHVQRVTSWYTVGPIIEAVGSAGANDLEFDLNIPSSISQLLSCELNIKPVVNRSPISGVNSGTHLVTWGIVTDVVAAGISVTIDGVDQTTALGGPWSAEVTIDITRYLVDADGIIKKGAIPIVVVATTEGGVEIYQHWNVVASALVAT